jgi:hypothetical protein
MIFRGYREDFFKIFAATFVVFVLTLTTNIIASSAFVLITIYFLDGGHVYSTLLEVLADPEEIQKKYVWLVFVGSFFLNLYIHYFLNPYFFYYIFYFTIFHNMRQGLGVTFLYRIGEKASATMLKWSYYFLTMVPFILFHLRSTMTEGQLGEAILRPIELSRFIPQTTLDIYYQYGLIIYFAGSALIISLLVYFKNIRGLLSLLFFTCVYAYSFLYSPNQMRSYALLIFSHAIPYFFLMEKRLELTHKIPFIKKYAFVFLTILFALGGVIDYYQYDLVESSEPFDSLAMALLTTPLISHFIFDAILWKRGNERFKIFVQTKAY